MSGKEQEVIALVDGDEEAITDFKAMVGARSPSMPRYRPLLVWTMRAML